MRTNSGSKPADQVDFTSVGTWDGCGEDEPSRYRITEIKSSATRETRRHKMAATSAAAPPNAGARSSSNTASRIPAPAGICKTNPNTTANEVTAVQSATCVPRSNVEV